MITALRMSAVSIPRVFSHSPRLRSITALCLDWGSVIRRFSPSGSESAPKDTSRGSRALRP